MLHAGLIHTVSALVVVVGFWLAPSFFTARLAERKGRSFAGWMIAALFLCWPLVLLAAIIAPGRRPA